MILDCNLKQNANSKHPVSHLVHTVEEPITCLKCAGLNYFTKMEKESWQVPKEENFLRGLKYLHTILKGKLQWCIKVTKPDRNSRTQAHMTGTRESIG